jgi:hypothetical protein
MKQPPLVDERWAGLWRRYQVLANLGRIGRDEDMELAWGFSDAMMHICAARAAFDDVESALAEAEARSHKEELDEERGRQGRA